MPINNLYYLLKPVILRYLQIIPRRKIARIKSKDFDHVGPIDSHAGKPRIDWRGWCEHKRFALVQTRSVDTACGQEKCLQLMEIEKGLGFGSSFKK